MQRIVPSRAAIDAEPLGLCACGQRIYAGAKHGTMAVLHVMPYCEPFRRLEPLEFLQYVRRSRGIPDDVMEEK